MSKLKPSCAHAQAQEQSGITARLYLATGIPITELAPQKDNSTDAVQAAWFPLRQVFDSDPEGSGLLVAPFLADLHRYLDRYKCWQVLPFWLWACAL